MKLQTKFKKAFSLIELSIVVLIIAILIAGVVQGSRLFQSFKINTARTITQSSPISGIKGLVLWLEPTSEKSFIDSETSENSTITEWKDINPQTKNFNNFTTSATTDITYTKDGINGLPSILFSGTSSGFGFGTGSSLSGTPFKTPYSAFTTFIVSKADVASREENLFSLGIYFIASKGSTYKNFWFNGGLYLDGTINNTTSPDITTFSLSPISVNGTTVTQYLQSWLNGVQDAPSSAMTNTYDPDITKDYSTPHIGNGHGIYDKPWNGLISEVIIFDHELSNPDRKAVEKYLGKKYGIFVS
jgi:prepilin-type N-terminal cleavage/methylation domain-containing protein